MTGNAEALEHQIAEWRAFVARGRAIAGPDVEELEGHLRDQIEALTAAGLDADEAFLVAVKRIGSLNALSREFAREHSERLWRQLVLGGRRRRREAGADRTRSSSWPSPWRPPWPSSSRSSSASASRGEQPVFYARNLSFFVLPFLAIYLAWKRGLGGKGIVRLLLPFAAAAIVVNLYPFEPGGHTFVLAAIHLPIALWLVAGLAYVGFRWRDSDERMNFVRFSGELFIYYVLIALGGGVLSLFTMAMFEAIGIKAEGFVTQWLLPCGATGAVLVGSWLVEEKQSVIENMAPVLTRIFTPLFTLALMAFLATMIGTGRGIDIQREVLIGFDLLLVVVLGLLLYSVSARDPLAPPGPFDLLQLTLVVSALIVDVFALAAIAARISDFGFTPNRTAALGENLILLVNLAWSAWLYARFLRGRAPFSASSGGRHRISPSMPSGRSSWWSCSPSCLVSCDAGRARTRSRTGWGLWSAPDKDILTPMRPRKILLTILLLALAGLMAGSFSSAEQLVSPEAIAPKMQWFADAKLGIFIHWGIYSVEGVDESWAFHNRKMPYAAYMRQLGGFTASRYDPAAWADLIRRSGARYAVITTKHHDGVALWDTKMVPGPSGPTYAVVRERSCAA